MKHTPHIRFPMRVKVISALIVIAVLGASVGVGFWWGQGRGVSFLNSQCKEKFIDPVACSGEGTNQLSYIAFKKDLQDQLATAQAHGTVKKAGIYFRDLRNGPAVAINSDETFIPMSLMKMPLMVSVLRYVQDHPEVLSEKVHTPIEFAANVQVMDKAQTLLPNHDYTIDELLSYLISYSDSHALLVLSQWMDQKAGRNTVINTLIDLGLMRKEDRVPESFVTPRVYGEILRILYSASYLNTEYSERAIDYLTKTTFTDGLTHDIPKGVLVAHKFGVDDAGNGSVQLHDCGIVYHPAGPYILCVMTNGTNYNSQASYIQDVANRVYLHVASQSEGR